MRRRHVSYSLIALVSVCSAVFASRTPAQAYDYAQNGGFEEGAAGWSSNYAEVDVVDASAVEPGEGARSARVVLQSSPFQVRQATYFDVPPGRYTFSVLVRRTATSPSITLQVQSADRDTSTVVDVVSAPDVWASISGALDVYKSENVQLSFIGSGSAGDTFFIDAVRFSGFAPSSPTPTPTFTALPTFTATKTPTGTRTRSPTKTPSSTRTPSAIPESIALAASLQNGGFEDAGLDGTPVMWRRFGGDLSVVSEPVHSGRRAARFESTTDSTKWVYQSVEVSPGEVYAFGAWVDAGDAAVARAFLRVSWYESDDTSGSAIDSVDSSDLTGGNAGFVALSTEGVVAPDSARSARLRIMLQPVSGSLAAIYVDDATFGPAVADDVLPAAANNATEPGGAPSHHATSGRAGAPLVSLGASAPAGTAGIVINEVLYDPDNGADDADGEWIELYNASDSVVDIGGWSVADASANDPLPTLVVPPRGFAILAASDSFADAYPDLTAPAAVLSGRIGNGLGNNGDALALVDREGLVVDAISWGADSSRLDPPIGDVPAGHSIERRVAGADHDRADDFVDNAQPSPGRAIPPVPAKPQPQAAASAPVPILAPSPSARRSLLAVGHRLAQSRRPRRRSRLAARPAARAPPAPASDEGTAPEDPRAGRLRISTPQRVTDHRRSRACERRDCHRTWDTGRCRVRHS